jgi:hypothetical protein
MEPQLRCFRLTVSIGYDEEVIWAYVQRSGGHISIRGDCIDFWVPNRAVTMFLCAWPDLVPQPQLDLY